MATLNQQLERAKKLSPEKIVSDLFKFIKSIEKELVAYNVATLNQDSEDIFGKPIGFYSPGTEFMTNGRKKAGEPFDLLESGKLLESAFSETKNETVIFGFKDPKFKDVLKNLWSEDIAGLQDDDKIKVIQTRLLPFLQNNIIRKGLGI
tara:strand:+ start:10982 stop:11428 length:447 start_codon:yes stop_codon:yes gene_type:complete